MQLSHALDFLENLHLSKVPEVENGKKEIEGLFTVEV